MLKRIYSALVTAPGFVPLGCFHNELPKSDFPPRIFRASRITPGMLPGLDSLGDFHVLGCFRLRSLSPKVLKMQSHSHPKSIKSITT